MSKNVIFFLVTTIVIACNQKNTISERQINVSNKDTLLNLRMNKSNCTNIYFKSKNIIEDTNWIYHKKAMPIIKISNKNNITTEITFNQPYEPHIIKADSLFKSDGENDYFVRINYLSKGILVPGQLIILNNKEFIIAQFDELNEVLLKMSKYSLNSSHEDHYIYNSIKVKKFDDIDIQYLKNLKYDTLITIDREIINNKLLLKENFYLYKKNKINTQSISFEMKSDFSLFWWVNCPYLICKLGTDKLYFSAAIF